MMTGQARWRAQSAATATGEAETGPLRLDVERSVKLAFSGASISPAVVGCFIASAMKPSASAEEDAARAQFGSIGARDGGRGGRESPNEGS